MAMKWTQTLIPTARQVPAEAEVPSHQLMLRAGLIRRLGAGVYDYLPLGLRSLHKAMQIVREEMAAADAVEVFLPALQPVELWERTGRREAYGENLFVLKDRHGREQALGPTHEEVVTELVGGYVESYKQLPLTLYQIQTKFRDEFRPRFGVLRSREFQMKDAYSFHLRLDGPGGLDEVYQKQYDAYCRIFARCGLPYRVVEAESGPIGGSASHEFMVPSPTGEDTILESDKGNYAANVEKARIGSRPVPPIFTPAREDPPCKDAAGLPPLEKVHTPNTPGIAEVSAFLRIEPRQMLKCIIYEASLLSEEEVQARQEEEMRGHSHPRAFVNERFFVLAVVRGDHEVNEAKLTAAVRRINPRIRSVVLMDPPLAAAHGYVVGYIGPQAANRQALTRVIVDHDAAAEDEWVTGGNHPDTHVRHFFWKRDVLDVCEHEVVVADVRNAREGDPSPMNDGGVLRATRGIEIGHVFKLGARYTEALEVRVLDEHNHRVPMIMGCYGIGVNRILASAIERQAPQAGHDDNGIVWPPAIAPYQVVVTPIRYEGQAKEVADRLAAELEAMDSPPHAAQGAFARIDVLIDDRDERPGVKFKDADLVGIPVRVTIGEKALANGQVEVKARSAPAGSKPELVAVDQAARRVAELLRSL